MSHPPVQCSDDLPLGQAPTNPKANQPPQPQPPLSSFSETPSALEAHGTDVQPDAERANPSSGRTPQRGIEEQNPQGAGPTARRPLAEVERDKIVIIDSTSGARIEAEGLARVMDPGGRFEFADESHAIVYNHPKKGKIKNKFKLTESQAEPTIIHLDVVSAGLTEDCYTLGKRLGVAQTTLQRIKLDYRSEGQHEINYRILACWKQESAPTTLRTLARALVDIGRGDLADELRKG